MRYFRHPNHQHRTTIVSHQSLAHMLRANLHPLPGRARVVCRHGICVSSAKYQVNDRAHAGRTGMLTAVGNANVTSILGTEKVPACQRGMLAVPTLLSTEKLGGVEKSTELEPPEPVPRRQALAAVRGFGKCRTDERYARRNWRLPLLRST